MSAVNFEVTKNSNESGTNLLRRFTRKVQESRMVQKLKGARYAERKLSHYVQKKNALRRLTRHEEMELLRKMGKIKSRR